MKSISEDLLAKPSEAARNRQKEEKMRGRFAILLAIAAVCVTAAWAAWSPEAKITGDGDSTRVLFSNNGHKVVFGPDGVGHLLWYGSTSGDGVYCNRYNPLTGWTADYQVSQSGEHPSVALDADGTTIHALWWGATLCYRKCVRSESGEDVWGEVVPLPQCGTLWPSMASDPLQSGHLVACWYDEFTIGRRLRGEAIGFVECIDGVWGTPIRLDSIAGNIRRCPSVSVAPNGDVFIAYFANAATGGCHMFVKTRHNGIWGTTEDATADRLSDNCEFGIVEANPATGNPHVIFPCRTVTKISKKVNDTTWAVYHSYRNDQGTWQSSVRVSVPRHGKGYGFSWHQQTMAFASDGTAYAAWTEYLPPVTSHGNMYSYYSGEEGTWSAPAWVSSDTSASYKDEGPFVAVDQAAGDVCVAWNRTVPSVNTEATEIWWRYRPLGPGSDGGHAQPTALSQSGVELFPNPVKAGRVTVQYSLPHVEPVRVTLLDVSGRAVSTKRIPAAERSEALSLDVSGLNAGVYVVKLESGSSRLTRKLVIR